MWLEDSSTHLEYSSKKPTFSFEKNADVTRIVANLHDIREIHYKNIRRLEPKLLLRKRIILAQTLHLTIIAQPV